MIIQSVDIKNFRSIKYAELEFFPRCQVLVGINEAGKSNILKALSLLSPDASPATEDIRQPLPSEDMIEESYVEYYLKLDEKETEELYLSFMDDNVLSHTEKTPIAKFKGKQITLKELCEKQNGGIYKINIKENHKEPKYYKLSKDFEIITKNWAKPSDKCPPEFEVEVKELGKEKLATHKLIDLDSLEEDIPKEYLAPISAEYINDLIGEILTKLIEEYLPEVIVWKYNEEYLLPPQTNLSTFINSPETQVPLKNMFSLAGIEDIKKTVESAKTASKTDLRNLLNRVAIRTTAQFKKVWKEYKNMKFKLIENGDNIDISVVDTVNHFELNQRSDGFKRFVTFLLMISAKNDTNELENSLLLIDEPDISLHPSGAKHLKNELIKISQKNYVFYSTHSIFMIDREKIERHLIVTKEKEVTDIKAANESNMFDEEVLYNAIGYSIFETLKKKNIIFEGWRDKKLFKTAMSRVPGAHKELKDKFKNIGYCHAKGVKAIRHITPIIELADRECTILSDADPTAIEKKREYEKDKGTSEWKTYKDVLETSEAITGEDFIKSSAFSQLIKNLKRKHSSLPASNEADLENPNKLKTIKKWLNKGGLSQQDIEKELETIKETVFNDLTQGQIKEEYYDLLHNFQP